MAHKSLSIYTNQHLLKLALPVNAALLSFWPAAIISHTGADRIDTTLHPIRWAVVAGLAAPALLGATFIAAKFADKTNFAHSALRAFRWVVMAEFLVLVVLSTIGLVYEHRARLRDATLFHPPGKQVDIGGYRLHINCIGTGSPTIVLEYGHQGSYFDWNQVQPEIAGFTRVCSYDRAGYGWSDPSPRPRLPSVMAEELRALLDAAGEKPPYVVVAHSFGGFNALMFTHKFPDEVSGLVLVDGLHTFSEFSFELPEKASLRMMRVVMRFGLPRWRHWCGGTGPEELRGEKEAISCKPELYDAFYHERALFSDDVAEIRGITDLGSVPLIVIAHDPKIGNMSLEFWQQAQHQKLQLSRSSQLVIATGSGHDIPLMRPDVIVAAVRKLVQSPGTAGHPGNSLR